MSIYKLSIYNTLKPNQLKQVKFQLLKKNEPYQIAELENISIVKCQVITIIWLYTLVYPQ